MVAARSAPCCAPVLPVACRLSFILMSLVEKWLNEAKVK